MKIHRLILVAAFVVLSGRIAQAQMPCEACDGYTTSCDTYCFTCETWSVDGICEGGYSLTTCGNAGRPCLEYNCTPNWVETGRTNVGTYGNAHFGFGYWFGSWTTLYWCDHHRVDLVTYHDTNECSTDSGYWNKTACQNYIDATKPQSNHYQDCCDGTSPFPPPFLDPTYTCNNYHSCW
jgi:hypothetical protein